MKNQKSNQQEFDELPPNYEIEMEKAKAQITKIYQKYGYSPIETRLLEQTKLLIDKGINNKQVLKLNKPGEESKKAKESNLALRFDLTVPLARYVMENEKNLNFPFKRYQIQKVYREEDGKDSKSRLTEFYQCDIDVIGQKQLSFLYDSEMPVIINEIFSELFKINEFVVLINNRKILEGLLNCYGINDFKNLKKAIYIIDDMKSAPLSDTQSKLKELGLVESSISDLLLLFDACKRSDPFDAIEHFSLFIKNYPNFADTILSQGIQEMQTVITNCRNQGFPFQKLVFDPKIVRNFDYYSGTVYETFLNDYPHIGSFCSGGRYDDLVGTLSLSSQKSSYPGVGISIGLSKLVPFLLEQGFLTAESKTTSQVLVTTQDYSQLEKYEQIAKTIRKLGINTGIYYNKEKLAGQLTYAKKMGFSYVIIANKNELEQNNINIKDMTGKMIIHNEQQQSEGAGEEQKVQQQPNNQFTINLNDLEKFCIENICSRPQLVLQATGKPQQNKNPFPKQTREETIKILTEILSRLVSTGIILPKFNEKKNLKQKPQILHSKDFVSPQIIKEILKEQGHDDFISEPVTTVSDCELFALRKFIGDVSEEENNWAKILTPFVKGQTNKYGIPIPPNNCIKLLNALIIESDKISVDRIKKRMLKDAQRMINDQNTNFILKNANIEHISKMICVHQQFKLSMVPFFILINNIYMDQLRKYSIPLMFQVKRFSKKDNKLIISKRNFFFQLVNNKYVGSEKEIKGKLLYYQTISFDFESLTEEEIQLMSVDITLDQQVFEEIDDSNDDHFIQYFETFLEKINNLGGIEEIILCDGAAHKQLTALFDQKNKDGQTSYLGRFSEQEFQKVCDIIQDQYIISEMKAKLEKANQIGITFNHPSFIFIQHVSYILN